MKVIKKINNNVAICLDGSQNELIAFGKGIGFPAVPYEITDLNKIDRTFYGINANYLDLLTIIPEEIFTISAKIVDYAKCHIQNEINANIVFTLADHINFAIQRYQKNMRIKMPFSYDIAHLYPIEMDIGEYATKMINEQMHMQVSKEEAVGVALHFINAENMKEHTEQELSEDKVIEHLTTMIEQCFEIPINREGFNFSRFVSHLQYLLMKKESGTAISSENNILYDIIQKEQPKTFHCSNLIKQYLLEQLHQALNKEEQLYLMLHINRLCSREDCNH